MSAKLTNKWTDTLAEKYGRHGHKGADGEEFFIEVYRKKGFIVTHYSGDLKEQAAGVDVLIENKDTGEKFTVDVKANLRNDDKFAIEHLPKGWLYNTKKTSGFIAHVNIRKRQMVIYPRVKMQEFLKTAALEQFYAHSNYPEIIYLDKTTAPSFVKWRQCD